MPGAVEEGAGLPADLPMAPMQSGEDIVLKRAHLLLLVHLGWHIWIMGGPTPTLLIVEDDPKTARSLVAGLQAQGFSVMPRNVETMPWTEPP